MKDGVQEDNLRIEIKSIEARRTDVRLKKVLKIMRFSRCLMGRGHRMEVGGPPLRLDQLDH